MDKNSKLIIDEKLVINKFYFEPMLSELTCSICSGLLNDAILCSDCDNPFCSDCINEWIYNKNQCVMKCNPPFKSKPLSRMVKNIMN